jgi:hypothetical protein
MKPHAFAVMPFGSKPDVDGNLIRLQPCVQGLHRARLEDAGLEVFRADQELRAGDIRTDMFQELLVADLVVADLTLANPNVWYELGVRHALRARGVVIVCGGKVTTAFDPLPRSQAALQREGRRTGSHDPRERQEGAHEDGEGDDGILARS